MLPSDFARGFMQDTVPPPPSQQRPGKRRPLAWIIALLILIAIGAAVWVHLQSAHSSARPPPAQSLGVATAARGDMPEKLSALGAGTPQATGTGLPPPRGHL